LSKADIRESRLRRDVEKNLADVYKIDLELSDFEKLQLKATVMTDVSARHAFTTTLEAGRVERSCKEPDCLLRH